MKVAITSTGTTLDADADPRFGRAEYFVIVDPDTMEYDVIENKQNLELPQGAGIQAGRTIVNQKVSALITGFCGPKAFKVLKSANIQILVGAKGKIRDIIEKYKKGELETADQANVEGHWA